MTNDDQPNTHDYHYTHRSSISMTGAMWERLQQVTAARHDPKFKTSDAVREAIRQYLDQSEDLIGSRKHFSKSLQHNLSQHEQAILFTLYALIFLVARLFVYLIKSRDGREIEPMVLIQNAVIEGSKNVRRLGEITASVQKNEAIQPE